LQPLLYLHAVKRFCHLLKKS